MKKTLFTRAFTLIELLVVISIIAILAGIALPVFSTVKEKGNQTKDLANGKQIGLALRLYSTDNEGRFPKYKPTNGIEDTTLGILASSNEAFRYICPSYVPTEKTFYLPKSGWTDLAPDEKTATAADTLKQGENQFAYCPGLTDTSHPGLPLVADGFGTTPGVYPQTGTEGDKGFVWKGKKAIVIRTDASGNVETVDSTGKVQGARGGTKDLAKGDLFEKVAGWLPESPINPL